jgi:hypothetical protein
MLGKEDAIEDSDKGTGKSINEEALHRQVS